MWLNRDIANILKDLADPITYGRLLQVSRMFYIQEPIQRKISKLYFHLASLNRIRHIDLPKILSPYEAFCEERATIRSWNGPKKQWKLLTSREREIYQNKFQIQIQKRRKEKKQQRDDLERRIFTVQKELWRLSCLMPIA